MMLILARLTKTSSTWILEKHTGRLANLKTFERVTQNAFITYLHLDLQSAWPEEGIIYHVFSVGHAYHQDIVKLVDSIYLGQ